VAAGIVYARAQKNHTFLEILDLKHRVATVLEFQRTRKCPKLGLCILPSLVKLSQEIKYNQLHALNVKPSIADK
jgi:hypothetical protein